MITRDELAEAIMIAAMKVVDSGGRQVFFVLPRQYAVQMADYLTRCIEAQRIVAPGKDGDAPQA